ncbi:hypothetical protein BX666DRAFT_1854941 [Dichotomocladium elegans]|nr:hypothetical protein BX666DRAFT_1854941 [Dichotomocladium elegans]
MGSTRSRHNTAYINSNNTKKTNSHRRLHCRQPKSPSKKLRQDSDENDSQAKISSSRTHHTTDKDKDAALLPTPPPSPVASPQPLPPKDESRIAEERLLAAKRQGQLKAVMNEFATLKRQGYHLTEQSYMIVLDAHVALRREGSPVTQMLQIFDELSAQVNMRPGASILSLMIRSLCKRDIEVQKTIAMLKRQADRAGEFSVGTRYRNDISQLQEEGNVDKALALFDVSIQEGCVGDLQVDVFNQLLRVLSHHGRTNSALHVYSHMMGMPKTSATYAAMINLFGRVGDVQSALSYFAEFKASTSDPCCHVYTALVDAYLKCDQVDNALTTVKHMMPSDGVKITTIPYNAIIRYYCANGQMDSAEDLIKCMAVEPDSSSYGPILSAYCQMNALVKSGAVYTSLLKTDISKAYGNLANYAVLCLKNGRPRTALQVVDDMKRAGLEPDAVLSEQIVVCYVQNGLAVEAVAALGKIVDAVSSRSLSKSTPRLVHAATCIMEALDCAEHFVHVLAVARTMTRCVPAENMPCAIADILVMRSRQIERDALNLKDFPILFWAYLRATPGVLDESAFASNCLELVDAMRRQDVGLAAFPEDIVIRVLARFQETANEAAAMAWHAAFDIQSDASLLTTERASKEILRAVSQGTAAEAIRIMQDEIINKGLAPLPEPLRDAIALAGKQGHLTVAQELYEMSKAAYRTCLDQGRADHAIYIATNSILIGYAQQGNLAQAKVYYDQIKHMGQYPDGNAYASLLLGMAQCASTTDEATDALVVYDEAKRHQVRPTTFFYNVIISKLAKARKLEPALRLFAEMQHFKLTPNMVTYSAVISACVRAGSEANACRLFDEMLTLGQELRIGPFNNMIQFYIRQKPNRERALAYFNELRRHQIAPSAYTYKLLMEAYCLVAPYDIGTAHQLLNDMQHIDGIQPQPTHYATLIYGHGIIRNDVEAAQKVFDEARQGESMELVYQAMMDTLISNDLLERAEEVYKQMCSSMKKSSSSPYIENLLLRGYGQKGLIAKAERLFRGMSDDKSKPNAVVREPSTYEAMIRAYMDNNMVSKARSVLDQMAQRQFPDKVVASIASLVIV